jgi:hypothetical protein
MSREKVRALKRAVRTSERAGADADNKALGSDSALLLLARSILFGHGRLAVIRLSMAVRAGAVIPGEHWRYCAGVVNTSQDRALQAIYLAAAREATCNGPTHEAEIDG